MKVKDFAENWVGIIISAGVGVTALAIKYYLNWPILDPLVVAILLGAIIKVFVKFNEKIIIGFKFRQIE